MLLSELPLHSASLQGDINRVRRLLAEEKFDPLEEVEYIALPGRHLRSFQAGAPGDFILDNEEEETIYEQPLSPLSLAARSGHSEVVKEFTKCLVNGSERPAGPLHMAALGGWMNCMTILVENGWPAGQVDQSGWTPLQVAAYKGHSHVVAYLLQHAEKDEKVGLALCLATEHGNCEACRHILSHSSHHHALCHHLQEAVALACEHHYPDILDTLLSGPVRCDSCSQELLDAALSRMHENPAGTAQVLEILFDHGISIFRSGCEMSHYLTPHAPTAVPSLKSMAMTSVIRHQKVDEQEEKWLWEEIQLSCSRCHCCSLPLAGQAPYHRSICMQSSRGDQMAMRVSLCSTACENQIQSQLSNPTLREGK